MQFTSLSRSPRTRPRRLATLAFALLIALVSLPAAPAQADVSASDPDCRYPAVPMTSADRILLGYYAMGPWPERKLGTNLTWTEDPFRDSYWQNAQHSLMWTLNLLQAELNQDPDDHRYANRLFAIIKDWESTNPRPGAPSSWAWSDHSTARRAIVLVCVNDLLEPSGENETLIKRMLKKHGDTLLEDGFYVKYGNHALDQSIALLEVGRVLDNETFKDKAEDRINEYIGRSVDTQGVMNEQSVYYQYYNFSRYRIAADRLRDLGRTPTGPFDRVALMPNFLAHATLPNGRYEMIGDTQDLPAYPIPGPRPEETVARFNAGYLFARSGWGRAGVRSAADETFFATKWGPAPILHGHHDGMSLTLASWGSRLLIDSGLYKYGGGAFRRYMQSRPAHNIVTVDGAAWNAKAGSGRVIDNTLVSNKYVDLELRATGYPGVTHNRRITYSRALDYLVVDDRLSSSTPRTYRQVWHLNWDTNPAISGSNVYTRKTRGNVLIAQLHGRPATRIVKGSTSPIQGWTSYRFGQLAKTPAVEAIQKGRSVRYITLLVPASGHPRPKLKSFRAFTGGYQITLTLGGKTETLTVYGKKVTVR